MMKVAFNEERLALASTVVYVDEYHYACHSPSLLLVWSSSLFSLFHHCFCDY